MANFVTVGGRLIPREHIALVEPYDPNANPKFQTSRDFKGRVGLVNRDSLLIEEPLQLFAEANSFRMLPMDRVATNPAVHFGLETFLPADGFVPAKAFATRLLWRDLDGNDQSKLLLSEPEAVLSIAVQGEKAEPTQADKDPVSVAPAAGDLHGLVLLGQSRAQRLNGTRLPTIVLACWHHTCWT